MRRGARVNGGDCCYQEEEDDDVSVASSSSSSVLRFPAGSFSLAAVGDGGGGMNYIEHPVSMMDTLAGVAIRYGVEVMKNNNIFFILIYLFMLPVLAWWV